MSDTTETPALASDTLRESIVDSLRSTLGDRLVDVKLVPNVDLWVRVGTEAWREAGLALRDMGFHYFCFLSAIDWMPSPFGRSMDSEVDNLIKGAAEKKTETMSTGYAGGDTRFQVFARVANIKDHWGITLKADVGDENPSIETWTKVYAGADWHEREAWEMFGIDFVGHPAVRKIYLPADFEGTPLRKDFPLLARMVKPWPGIVDVEPMPGSGDDEEGEDAS